MTEIVGGLNVKDVAEGGAVFEVKYDIPPEEVDESYFDEVELHTKMECLGIEVETYDGEEPFENIAKKMVDLIPNGKIKKCVIREGYGPKPDQATQVQIHYNAYVQYEAIPFDSTYSRKKTFSFEIGDGQVIEGLELAVLSMKINEKSHFLIDPELAYRSSGLGRIPPNSVVLFEIELYTIMQPPTKLAPNVNEKEFSFVYPFCLGQCVKGKRLFRLRDYNGAIKEYNIAVNKLEQTILNDYQEQQKSDELLVRLYTNLLICSTNAQNPKRGCIYAQRIYEMSKNKTFKITAKVYFNHAKCIRMLGDFEKAEQKLSQAKKLEPCNPEILKEHLAIKRAAEDYRQKEKVMGKALVNT